MNWTGRKPKLTAERAAELRRYIQARREKPAAYRDVTDEWLCQNFGICKTSLGNYRQGKIKRYA